MEKQVYHRNASEIHVDYIHVDYFLRCLLIPELSLRIQYRIIMINEVCFACQQKVPSINVINFHERLPTITFFYNRDSYSDEYWQMVRDRFFKDAVSTFVDMFVKT